MLFRIPEQEHLNNIKRKNRKFEEFYLKSLKKLINTFERVALWCDKETAQFLKNNGLDKKILMRVMDFSELPQHNERDNNLKLLSDMQKNVGFLLKHKKPVDWLDYFTIISAKPAIIRWASENNIFNSDYFMWVDSGAFNPNYALCWRNLTGSIKARPERCRFCIAPTLGKSRPHFVPRFVYNIYKKFTKSIKPATYETLARQNMTDIAMINADYDVPGGSFMIPKHWANLFSDCFDSICIVMRRHGLVSVEQAVFQTMMKFDDKNMFELSYIEGYTELYTSIAKEKADHLL
ncbi:MAG: hypothetical protein JW974_00370 [Alphaproteobacteria bacterium]|nr:hypothetical protein [Alphaproteobacteria bacterium]MBN2675205.1 hypothetical protein [Alphaproteobacteria bacterium]